MTDNRVGVLVMSYGTPNSFEEVEAYYTHIRRGIPPSPEQLQALMARYEAIVGGFFPLRRNTDNQVAALQQTLQRDYPAVDYVCVQGLKHAAPFIEDGVEEIAAAGIRRAVGIVLAPHYSRMSIGGYIERARKKAEETGVAIRFVKSYHDHPLLIEALAERVKLGLERFPPDKRAQVRVIFTAHSLPAHILDMHDPYPQQLMETSRLVAETAGVTNWQFAWQSAGQTGVPWLGPDILEVLETVNREEGVNEVLICPVGFVSDHLEILYDIDIECRRLAQSLGIHLERTEMLNADAKYMKLLADTVHRTAEEG
ncbi:ferrochelatase [Brevibacillus sp. SYP-B805]|uniref:ferrochelatase n=1 Tax=Brevibacillus sp. SYP-B805 TaxID=1578199 RepID=UPI0013EDAF49|nr:ferrochelatase [Brevibacillus sp. SYP-B805]NGQ93953.1 ferrochelatase [Brevibacillus sp. SYP-B805]